MNTLNRYDTPLAKRYARAGVILSRYRDLRSVRSTLREHERITGQQRTIVHREGESYRVTAESGRQSIQVLRLSPETLGVCFQGAVLGVYPDVRTAIDIARRTLRGALYERYTREASLAWEGAGLTDYRKAAHG